MKNDQQKPKAEEEEQLGTFVPHYSSEGDYLGRTFIPEPPMCPGCPICDKPKVRALK